MINASKITNFNQTKYELEEHILFWILVAGKKASTISKRLNILLEYLYELHGMEYEEPFEAFRRFDGDLEELLKKHGFGCQKLKSKAIREIISSGLNLKTCTVDDLEKISGIGKKTSRCFLTHSRPNQRLAGIDTHMLKWLKSLGYEVPESTPQGRKYKEIEKLFLNLADKFQMSPAELDLTVWNYYSGNKHLVSENLKNKLFVEHR